MKDIKVSPEAEVSLADILEYSIGQWGLSRAEDYKNELLKRIRGVARNELPHPMPCEVLMLGKRDVAGLCYCREGAHFIILRETATCLEVVEFIHESRDLDRLIAGLAGEKKTSR